MKDFFSFMILPDWALWLLCLGIILKSYEQVLFCATCIRSLKPRQIWMLPLLRTAVPGTKTVLYRLSFGGLVMIVPLLVLLAKNDTLLTTGGFWLLFVAVFFSPQLTGFAVRIVMTCLYFIELVPKVMFLKFINFVARKGL